MRLFIIVLIIAVLVIAGYYFFGRTSDNYPTNSSLPSATLSPEALLSPSPSQSSPPSSSPKASSTSTVKNFTIDGRSYSFSPSSISVNKGDTVNITFVDESGSHNLTIDGYNVKTETIQTGQSQTLHFLADKSGTFQFYCTVDSHRELGMQGTLTVR